MDVAALYFLYWTIHVHISLSRCAFAFSGIDTWILVSFVSFVFLIDILRHVNCKFILRFDSTLHLRLTFVPAFMGKLMSESITGSEISEKEGYSFKEMLV